jgi:hypothetical protein
MPDDKLKYDVAISFLAEDVSIAQAIHEKLVGGLDVFFFPRNQEELAGTDGLESMRAPFLRESRLNVVVYRPKWGKTRWTAVEEQAIIDSCLNNSFRSIFLYVVENTATLPKWLPENYVYFSSASYALDEAVGAIKARVQERGGEYKPLTPAKKAEMNRAEEEYRQAKSYIASLDGIAQIFSKVRELFEEIRRQCDEVNQAGNDSIEYRVSLKERQIEQNCTLGGPRVGMAVFWYQPYGNLLDKAILGVREFNENIIIPPGHIRITDPEVIHETMYGPDISRAREYGWSPQRGGKGFISSKELASQCVIQILDLMDRDAAGKIGRKSRH